MTNLRATAVFTAVAALSLWALCAATAWAKDYKAMPSVEVGGRWFFAYEQGAEAIRINPGLAVGGTYTQIFDFDWARNVSFELNYLHSESRGETEDESTGDETIFDLTADTPGLNIGYFFTGRKILPYMSAGFGSAFLKYEPESNVEKLWETCLLMNLGGGADWTVFETGGGSALEKILLGARVRYEYYFIQKTFDTALNALAITARLEARF
ncbi:outer membrane beta-barrel protein [bacterium]|nr:outer membrane beta-barrel protein [bacterium]MCB9477064.1 outer membrane beta-barrel protein [Deltaproteobacteria bacterium]